MSDLWPDPTDFPAVNEMIRAAWAPIMFEPIRGSYERFVVGVAAGNETGFHLELANALERLRCLYGDDADGAIRAIEIAGRYLNADLAKRSLDALSEPDPGVRGIRIGEIREAEGNSLEAIARSWLSALSSLYVENLQLEDLTKVQVEGAAEFETAGADRLPFLVCDYVQAKREGFADFFSEDLRRGQQRRSRGSSHRIVIDFSGSRLVANFGTLKAGALTNSVNRIKQRLWDLKVERDREPHAVFGRKHEMILHRPSVDDPQVSEKQQSNLAEAYQELEHQADQEELRLRAMRSVKEIGEHIIALEAA